MSPADAALKRFEAAFGKTFGDERMRKASELPGYEVISTGSLTLDYAMGCGGYIIGRLTELWGAPSTGKTTLALVAAAEAQRAYPDKLVGFIDVEQTLDREWAEAHGVDLERMRVIQPETAEDVADVMKLMLESGVFIMVILDSIGAMLPGKEAEKDAGDAVVGLGAKVATRMVKIATARAQRHGVAVILINQIRDSIGSFVGPSITKPGGHAVQHCTTHVIKTRRSKEPPFKVKVDGTEIQVGQQIVATLDKNKVAPPKRSATIDMFNQATEQYGPVGIDQINEAWAIGKRLGVIEQSGAWYTLPGGSQHHGEKAVKDYLRDHRDLVSAIREQALAAVAHEVVDTPMEEG